jgi:signal transduction histidine kinase
MPDVQSGHAALGSLRLLYAEDDALQRKQLSVFLGPKFADVTVATNGQEALRLYRQQSPDMVISDIEMPLMTGLEMAAEIKSCDRDVPIILTTAISDTEHLLDAIRIGIDNYVVKPVIPSVLMTTISKSAEILFARREIAAQNARLRELNAQKNEWLGIAAHDLRNPLGVIQGYAEFMLELGAPETFTEMLERMRDSSEFMKRLLEELLDISKIESGQLKLHWGEHDFARFLDECVELNRVFSEQKGTRLVCEFDTLPDALPFDRDKIEQVVNNLLSNAVKYSPGDTTITVTAGVDGDHVRAAVVDQGPGIPAGELDGVFAAFSKTSVRATGGEKSTGLGLAIAKKVVERHGGEIGVTSSVGDGSTFFFTLPLTRAVD